MIILVRHIREATRVLDCGQAEVVLEGTVRNPGYARA